MQFGHNDPSPLAGDSRERGTIRGMGDETQDVVLTLPPNKGKAETVHSYGWYMKQYCAEARAKGMSAVVCSYVPRAPRVAGAATAPSATAAPIESDKAAPMSSYQLWAKQAAEAEGATFVDLFALINAKYAMETPEAVKREYFTDADNTHQSPAGAALNAACVVEGLREVKSPLVAFLVAK